MDSHYFSAFINATENAEDPVDYLYCSVVTKSMVEYDSLMFGLLKESSGDNDVFYRPYYSGFVIPIDPNGKAKGNFGNDQNYETIRLAAKENGKKRVWFKAHFNDNDSQNVHAPYVEGSLLLAASPMKYFKGKLELREIDPNDAVAIEKEYTSSINLNTYKNKKDVENLINNNIGDISKALIYNIGHANFITFDNDKGQTKMIYDIGLPYRKSYDTAKNDYKGAFHKIKNIRSKMVIISHWDEDHYVGAYINEKNIFDIPWIVTGCSEKGKTNAKRIILHLNNTNHLYMIKRAIDDSSVLGKQSVASVNKNGRSFELYRGEGKSSEISEINRYGLALRIDYNNTQTLMCADIPYRCLPDSIIDGQTYEYVVIPHHASNMTKTSYKKLDKIKSIEYSFVCVDGDEALCNRKNKNNPNKTVPKVKDGDHYKYIDNKTSNNTYFTDDPKHSVVGYECSLDKKSPPCIIP